MTHTHTSISPLHWEIEDRNYMLTASFYFDRTFLLNIITLNLQLIFSVNTQPKHGGDDEAVT